VPDKSATTFKTKIVPIESLHPHPKNYRAHPDDQLDHIIASIRQHGFYRNVVVARDGIILAGHGVVQAAKKMCLKEIPIVSVDVDSNSPEALKILVGDNEISHLCEIDDRALTDALKDLKDLDTDFGLLGSGYDEMQLANLLMVTRPASEIQDIDEAKEWIGMPEFEPFPLPLQIIVSFETEEARERFGKLIGIKITEKTKSTWFPPKEREDPVSMKFESEP
jgi:hypothetical protein